VGHPESELEPPHSATEEEKASRATAISQLEALIARALPTTSTQRRGIIVRALLKEDLTVSNMQAVVETYPQNHIGVLFSALDLEDAGGSQLRRGERLAVITALVSSVVIPA
jgi:hypothetical protein